MSIKRTVTRNAIWNWAGLGTIMVSGFVLAPFLVHRLGEANYGLWVLILSLASSLTLLDFGLRMSIARYIAFYKAREDYASLATVRRTAQLLMLVAAGAVVTATLAIQLLFGHVFSIPPEQITEVRFAMLLAGASIAVTLGMAVYDATLWSYERFDLINAIEITANVAQVFATVYLVRHGHSVLALAAALFVTTCLKELGKLAACALFLAPDCENSAKPTRDAAKRLAKFGIWASVQNIGMRGTLQSVPMVIGARLGLSSVTPFNVATTLTNYARSVVTTGADVVAPLATALHAADRHEQQRRLFIDASKYSWALALLLTSGMILLGKPFLTLWMGTKLAGTSMLLIVLAIGEALPMSQRFGASVIRAHNRHRVLGLISIVEAILVITLGFMLARAYGLLGVCVAVATCGTVCRGIVPMLYGCRIINLPLRQYALHALLAPLAVAAAPVFTLAMIVRHHAPASWLEFIAYAAAFSITFAGLAVMFLRVRPDVIEWSAPPAVAESA